jgi:predicted PurR-regulated permease PerM
MIDQNNFEKQALEAAIRIAVVGVLTVWTFNIIRPFFMPVIWGVIIAVAIEPFIERCTVLLKGRRKLVSILFALSVIVALIMPLVIFSASSLGSIQSLFQDMDKIRLEIPVLPESVKEWPLIGPAVSSMWLQASSNLGAVLKQFAPQLKLAAGFFLGSVGGGLKAFFMFIVSIIIASVLLVMSDSGIEKVRMAIRRFAGKREPEITALAIATIRGVMLGVVGVAVIQSVLAAAGMLVADIPLSGLWALLVLVCAVIQLPPIIILGPIAAWYFTVSDTTGATMFLVWSVIVSSSDSVLKPLLIGRGVDIPMLVILIGALGGMMLSGIIGLFTGAVIVAITYKLFMAWVEEGA